MCSAAYGNFYILSSWRSGVFSSCCLALDSSSSFPCPAFRAIAKSRPEEDIRFSESGITLVELSDLSSRNQTTQNLRKSNKFVYLVNYIDRFSYVEPTLHSWDEAHLVMLDNFLMCSLIRFANILLSIIESVFMKEIFL
ncbi:hypothetical protein STEG23_017002 [Scotinomys teguina]